MSLGIYRGWGSIGFCGSAHIAEELLERDVGFPTCIQLREKGGLFFSKKKKKDSGLRLTFGNFCIFHFKLFLKTPFSVRWLENYHPSYVTSPFLDKGFWITIGSQPNSTVLFLPFGLQNIAVKLNLGLPTVLYGIECIRVTFLFSVKLSFPYCKNPENIFLK